MKISATKKYFIFLASFLLFFGLRAGIARAELFTLKTTGVEPTSAHLVATTANASSVSFPVQFWYCTNQNFSSGCAYSADISGFSVQEGETGAITAAIGPLQKNTYYAKVIKKGENLYLSNVINFSTNVAPTSLGLFDLSTINASSTAAALTGKTLSLSSVKFPLLIIRCTDDTLSSCTSDTKTDVVLKADLSIIGEQGILNRAIFGLNSGTIYYLALKDKDGKIISNTLKLSPSACLVKSAEWVPFGLYPYKAMVDAADKTPFVVHMKIKTQNCAGKRLNIHIKEMTVLIGENPANSDLRQLLVHKDEFLDIPVLPGDLGCNILSPSNFCIFYMQINKSDNGPTKNFDSSEDKNGNTLLNGILSLSCVGSCNDSWKIFPTKEDLGVNVSSQPSVEDTGIYTLLAPLPKADEPGGTLKTFNIEGGLTPYLRMIFQILIGLAGLLAVIMIVVGGLEYMSSDAVYNKEEGLKKLNQAVLGLLIALGAWILLNTINPQLVGLGLSSLTENPATIEFEGEDTPQTGQIGTAACVGKYGDDWIPSGTADSTLRSNLSSMYNISVNKLNCAKIGQASCTSLTGLDASGVLNLRRACPDCELVITGGTECWLHKKGTSHGPGSPTIDIRATNSLNKLLTGKEDFPGKNQRYGQSIWGGKGCLAEGAGTYTQTTGNHWHCGN